MKFKSNKVSKMESTANRIYPIHGSDSGDYFFNKLIQDSSNSSLLNLFLNNELNTKYKVTATDKEVLMKAWSNIDQKEVDHKSLNSLRIKGLIGGVGKDISLTKKGEEALIEAILDAESTFKRQAERSSLVKTAQVNKKEVEKMKVYRNKDGKWVAKEENENPVNDIENMNNETLASLYKSLVKAEQDCFKNRKAGSGFWDSRYDLNKVHILKEAIKKEIKKREK